MPVLSEKKPEILNLNLNLNLNLKLKSEILKSGDVGLRWVSQSQIKTFKFALQKKRINQGC